MKDRKTMERILQYTMTKEDALHPLLFFLKQKGYSQTVVTHLKRTENGLLLNNEWARVWDIPSYGDILTVRLVEPPSPKGILPVSLPFPVVYEDKDLLVIDKPAGMPIHPSQGNYENTLANAAAWYFAQKNEPFTFRCINRLDRDTTGLLILARHMYSASLLSDMVKERRIKRTYLAVTTGLLPERGTIDAPIARKEGSTIERCVDETAGEYARTHFCRICEHAGYSLAKIRLETGRTHQIRVHMKHIGHPLPGDFLYNPDYSHIKRQALHSYKLEFPHPIWGIPLSFTSPLPEDMKQFFIS